MSLSQVEDIEQNEEEEEGSKLERKSLCSLCWREGGRDASQGRTQFSTDCHKDHGGTRCRVAVEAHYMIGSKRVPGVPLPCNSVTGSTDLSYRLVRHSNTHQQRS